MTNASGSERRPVLVVGVGDDGPAGLPPSVRARIEQADLLVGGRRHLDLFAEGRHERLVIAGGLDGVLERIARAAENCQVVVLASGDPCYFGIGPLLAERLGPDRVEILPHLSSVALAFARLAVAWQDATVVSAHGRRLEVAIRKAHGAHKLAVLTDETNTPAVVASALLAAGADDRLAWVFEHLGGPRESAFESNLSELGDRSFAPLNLLVVPELTWCSTHAELPGFGLPESAYQHTAGLITKPEVRAVSLSKLRLRAGGVLWDVGAGSGSLAIEAAGLARDLTVYAVERSARQISMLRANVEKHAPDGRVRVIDGEAPGVLAQLPDPGAIFVGGSGGHLAEILDLAFDRISRPGRIVANLVTLENTGTALAWARRHHLDPEVVQVSIGRGADILGMTRLQAENPVTVVTVGV